jgi:hypothetical protein
MANTGQTPIRLLKTLLFAAFICVCLAGFLIVGGVVWFRSFTAGPPAERERFPGTVLFARHEVTPPFEIPKTFSGNAILAGKVPSNLPGHDIFTDLQIPKLQIILESEEKDKLEDAPREYVRCSIREGDRLYTNVAIRLKGSIGSFRHINDIPSFTVNFDKFVEDQTFHGLKKIHLNSSVQDGSLLEEKISRELFEAAGVPAPRSGHAEVTLNKRRLGVYVLVEGINKQFLKRYSKDPGGNVYEGKLGNDVTGSMRTNSGDTPRDKSRLRALATAVREPDLDERLNLLNQTLDIDRFLSFMAMEMILWHWDGYTMHRNNYRVFHDRAIDRMVFFPQGLDQMLNEPGRSVFPQQPAGSVARAVLEVPELRERYRARVAEIATNVFQPERITSRIYEVSMKVQEALNEVDSRAAADHPRQADALRRRIRARAQYLDRLINPPSPLAFDNLGFASLEKWQPQTDLGEATLTQENDSDGTPVLRIETETGCTASWRTTVKLPPGKYQFQANVRTIDVVLDPADERAGAGLRISRHRSGQKNSATSTWTAITFDFEATIEKPEIELICELRANSGQILYDRNSLRLQRI